MGIALGTDELTSRKIVTEIKRMEDEGYRFDAAEGGALPVSRHRQKGRKAFSASHFDWPIVPLIP